MIIPAIEIVICLVIVWALTQLRITSKYTGEIMVGLTLVYFTVVGSAGAWLALDALQRLGVIAP